MRQVLLDGFPQKSPCLSLYCGAKRFRVRASSLSRAVFLPQLGHQPIQVILLVQVIHLSCVNMFSILSHSNRLPF
jgi:hypothetical protein